MNATRSQLAAVFSAWLALWLCGCAGPEPQQPGAREDQLTIGKVQGEIKVGLSGAAVIEILGSPNIITTDDKRRETWVYDKVSTERMDASSSSYGTLIIFGGSTGDTKTTTRQRTLTIIIKFDEQKLVNDFAYHYTQF